MKIVYISGSRADYGLMKKVLKEISLKHNLKIVATGMHVMDEFGKSIEDIKSDKFEVLELNSGFLSDNRNSVPDFISDFSKKLSDFLLIEKPDMILLLGDRPESLTAAIVASYLSIPIAHVHGGDISATVDDPVRHSITKLAHLHFPATEKSAERIFKMGEEEWRIHCFGAPGVERMSKLGIDKSTLKEFNLPEKFNLFIQHPVSDELEDVEKQIAESLAAIKNISIPTVLIYPNADPGGRRMIQVIEEQNIPFLKAYKNISHSTYLQLLAQTSVLVGNSSSGIIEAASFRTPVVNIGTRQKGREKNLNVIDTYYDSREIEKAIRKALSPEFSKLLQNVNNLYEKEDTAINIARTLNSYDKQKLVKKEMNY